MQPRYNTNRSRAAYRRALHAEIQPLLADLLPEMQNILQARLVGLYLYGSAVTGDFDPGLSDVDLLAAIADPLTPKELDALEAMHLALVQRYPDWDDRIEILYYPVVGLKTFRTARSPIAVISPGEPFNLKDAGRDWLMNWYLVRKMGRTLYGPDPTTLIDPIPDREFIESVREHALSWPAWIEQTRGDCGYQAYAVLTLCRTLYTVTHARHVSKREAANWVAETYAEWATTAQRALAWRASAPVGVDPEATYSDTQQFLHFVAAKLGPTGEGEEQTEV